MDNINPPVVQTHDGWLPLGTPGEECPSCGARLKGKFCHKCGEKKVKVKDFAIHRYSRQMFSHATHLDFKVLTTLGILISKPGQLSVEFMEGRRINRMKPLQLLLLLNLVFFFFYKSTDVFAPQLKYVLQSRTVLMDGSLLKERLAFVQEKKQLGFDETVLLMDIKITQNAKAFLYLFVPVLALFLQPLYFRRYRYYICQLIFATHWFAFLLVFFGIILPVFMIFFHLKGIPLLTMALILLMPYTFLALKRFYRENVGWTAVKCVLFLAAFSIVYLVYRNFILWLSFILV